MHPFNGILYIYYLVWVLCGNLISRVSGEFLSIGMNFKVHDVILLKLWLFPENGRKKKKTRTTFSRAQVFGLERKFATQVFKVWLILF